MLSYDQVVGMPVIGLDDGSEVGSVKHAMIDADKGRVVALAIDSHHWWRACRIAMLEDVVGVGDEVIVVAGSARLFTIADRPDFEKVVLAEPRLLGRRVFTKAGVHVGEVASYSFDQSTGSIAHLEVQPPSSADKRHLDYQHVLVLGRDVVVINEEQAAESEAALDDPALPAETAHAPYGPDADPEFEPHNLEPFSWQLTEQELRPEPAPVASIAAARAPVAAPVPVAAVPAPVAAVPAPVLAPPAPPRVVARTTEIVETPRFQTVNLGAHGAAQALAQPVIEQPEKVLAPPVAPMVATAVAPAATPIASPAKPAAEGNGAPTTGADLARLFRERQERFLLGKAAQRPVKNDSGQILVSAGDIVDQTLLDLVKEAGKLLELTASVSLRR